MAHQIEGGHGHPENPEKFPHINLDDHHNCPPHFHADEQGFLVKCYHHCKSFVKMPSFWIAQTFLFPFEHFLWTKAPGFSHIAEFLGLISH